MTTCQKTTLLQTIFLCAFILVLLLFFLHVYPYLQGWELGAMALKKALAHFSECHVFEC